MTAICLVEDSWKAAAIEGKSPVSEMEEQSDLVSRVPRDT